MTDSTQIDAGDLLDAKIEALLFVTSETLSVHDLAKHAGATIPETRGAVERLQKRMEGRGVVIVERAGGYRMATNPSVVEAVESLLQTVRTQLPEKSLQVLAIIAYCQPISRQGIVESRGGINSDGIVDRLLKLGFIEEVDESAIPREFRTTKQFLESFGLNSLDDLPEVAPEILNSGLFGNEDQLAAFGLPIVAEQIAS